MSAERLPVADWVEPAGIGRLVLPLSGWSIQLARGTGDRPAIEVYAGDRLLDVSVASSLGTELLRGAYRGTRGERRWTLAWGRIPPGQRAVVVVFSGGPPAVQPHVTVVAGAFWVAEAAGSFKSVAVSAGAVRTSRRPRRA